MKLTVALLAVLPSLAWAQTYSEIEHAPDTVEVRADLLAGLPSAQPASQTAPNRDCRSDNNSVSDFPDLLPLRTAARAPVALNRLTRHSPSPPDSVGRLNHTTRRPGAPQSTDPQRDAWAGGMARLRVRGGKEGTTDYGSAVCVGFGRTPGEWTFLSCSHNFESGGDPELQLAGEWVPATLLYRDKLAEAVETAPGQYTRVEAGPDRSVLVVHWPGRLRFHPVSLQRYVGEVVLSGYPSTPRPVMIAGQTEEHPSAMKAALERPSQGGFSGGGVFNAQQQLVGIWTSGARGSGYGHYVAEFLPIFRQLGWAPGNWRLSDSSVAQQR